MRKSLECHMKINFNPSIVKLSWKFASSISLKQKLLFNENVYCTHILQISHGKYFSVPNFKNMQHTTYIYCALKIWFWLQNLIISVNVRGIVWHIHYNICLFCSFLVLLNSILKFMPFLLLYSPLSLTSSFEIHITFDVEIFIWIYFGFYDFYFIWQWKSRVVDKQGRKCVIEWIHIYKHIYIMHYIWYIK